MSFFVNVIRHFFTLFGAIILAGLFTGCSSERNSWTSKSYHNLTAHYNGYYYAREEINKIEAAILAANLDDYNRILRLYPTFDSSMAKGYEKETEEAIKMASIAIQRHPNSKWVDDAYILVGKARLYSLDWGNAIETFKYVNSKSEDAQARHQAIIELIRTFTEHQEFNNAQAAIDYLQKQKLNAENQKSFLLNKAYFHQVQEDYDNMVRSLTTVSPLLKKSDRRGRIYFIVGQVYQELGFESEAFNFYRKCLATNPEYETDFYARLNMAQVAEISRSRDINTARKSFRRLLKDSKNKDFKDKIYYELGAFEYKQKNLPQAIANFNLAIREGKDPRVDGVAYLRLGEMHYDTLKQYAVSKAYYDSAINALPKDFENYDSIKRRQEILTDFVNQIETITWQDSLLGMAALDSAVLRARVDSVFAEKKRLEDLAASKRKKKRNNRISIEPTEVNIFDTGTEAAGADWYFGNPSAMSLGESEFRRVWGDVKLEDDWRRSLRISSGPASIASNAPVADSVAADVGEVQQVEAVDPALAEFERINNQIPRTPEQTEEALKKIEEAYFRLGDIYYFELNEKENAAETYARLMERFPESEYTPEALYKLYLIYKESDPEKARQLSELLIREHPYSTFAKILANPNFLKEASQTAEKQKEIYKEAYAYFQAGDYVTADLRANEAIALGETTFVPHLELLKILVVGRLEPVEQYRNALAGFSEKYAESELIPYVKKLVAAAEKTGARSQQVSVRSFSVNMQAPHYFVVAFDTTSIAAEAWQRTLADFNDKHAVNGELKVSTLDFNGTLAIGLVTAFPDGLSARQYLKTFVENGASPGELKTKQHARFVISSGNFNIFYRTKGLHEYIEFFEKNYQPETP